MQWPWQRRRSDSVRLGIARQAGSYAAICLEKGSVTGSFPEQPGVAKDDLESLGRWISSNKLTGAHVDWVLGRDDYHLHLAEAPAVSDEELSDVLKFRLAEQPGFSPEEHVVQAFRLPEQAYHGRMSMAYAVAVEKHRINELVSWCHSFQLTIGQISIREMAMLALLAEQEPETSVAILEFEDEKGSLSLFQHGALYLHRELKVGLDVLSNALVSESMPELVPGMAMDFSDNTDGLGFGAMDLSLEETTSVNFSAQADESPLESLSLEIQRSLDYFDSQLGMGVIGQIWVLTRSGLDVETLMLSLEQNLAPALRPLSFRHFFDASVENGSTNNNQLKEAEESDLLCLAWGVAHLDQSSGEGGNR